MTDIYIVRHGQSQSNLDNIFAGHLNADLSDIGKKQAELLRGYFKNIHIDKIISSDLKRAYNTILPTAREHGLTVIKNKNLREIFAGEWEGVKFDVLSEKYKEEYSLWRTDIAKSVCTGGESVAEVAKRITEEIKNIAKENDGKTVVIATHATPIKALFSIYKTGSADNMKNLDWIPNASVTHIIFENGIPRFISEGETNHLGELQTNLPDNV